VPQKREKGVKINKIWGERGTRYQNKGGAFIQKARKREWAKKGGHKRERFYKGLPKSVLVLHRREKKKQGRG